MATYYRIRDSSNGLLITSGWHPKFQKSQLGSAIVCALVMPILLYSVPETLLPVGLLLAGFLGVLVKFWAENTQLFITRNEFESRGPFGSHRFIPTADIQFLEFQPCPGQHGSRRGGLNARLKFGSVCVLPMLDENQTNEIIESISNRFPEMAKDWSVKTSPELVREFNYK